jgi:hypothetical protein
MGIRWSTIRGRRLLFATCACLAAASLFGLLSVMVWTNQSEIQVVLDQEGQQFEVSKSKPNEWSPLTVLRGPPTDSLWGGYHCTPSNPPKLINFWQTTCVTTQSISHRGLQQAGVRGPIYFDDT